MNIIKLNAIDSTNDFLKNLSRDQELENFTIVTALNQTKGRGQMGALWQSEAGKNLTISILVKNTVFDVNAIYDLNIAIALSLIAVLKPLPISNLSIKWPNDIMAGDKKLGGILIENRIKSAVNIESVVGIGLNINQRNFDNLNNATSLFIESGQEFDLDDLISKIVLKIQQYCVLISTNKQALLWCEYHKNLYKINVPSVFEETSQRRFTAQIIAVTAQGQLQISDDENKLRLFGIKEIKMIF